jgi:hypothetical protein
VVEPPQVTELTLLLEDYKARVLVILDTEMTAEAANTPHMYGVVAVAELAHVVEIIAMTVTTTVA